ncbi:MAG: two-component regulator propeller domain-containing protein [Bacteroidota bacterium]|nr:two-component regulator propeller domain-containing protein [Bacteroidota bacterium]
MYKILIGMTSLIVSLINLTYSQEYNEIRHFSSANGLSNNSVTCIIQDPYKFIWIGTNNGLNLFDGDNFKVYNKIAGNSTSLPDETITGLFVDSKGWLWVGTAAGGACIYNPVKESFKRIVNKPQSYFNQVDNKRIIGFAEDRNSNVWIATLEGLNKFNRKGGSIEQFYATYPAGVLLNFIRSNRKNFPVGFEQMVLKLKKKNGEIDKYLLHNACIAQYGLTTEFEKLRYITNGIRDKLTHCLLDDKITSLYADYAGFIWIGYLTNGFSRFDPLTHTFKHYPFLPSLTNMGNISTFCKLNSRLYIGFEGGGIEVLDLSTGKQSILPHRINLKQLKQICRYDANHLWIVSANNLQILDVWKNTFIPFINYNKYEKLNIHYYSNCIYTDYQGNRLIGSQTDGFFLCMKSNGFMAMNSNDILSADNVSAMCMASDQSPWVGYSSAGLDHIYPGLKKRKTYTHQKGVKNSFASESTFAVFQDKKNNIWIGNYQMGLQHYNPKRDNFTTVWNNPGNPNSLSSNDIRSITEDKDGDLWLATQGGGLCKYDYVHNHFTNYKADYLKWQNHLPTNWLTDVAIDKSGMVWIGTADGFSVLNTQNQHFRSYKSKNSLLPDNYICDVYIDNHQNIWLGTKSGLAVLDRSCNQLNVFTTKEGLPSNYIKAILQDGRNRFWISTNLGIFCCQAYKQNGILDKSLLKSSIYTFDVSDGLLFQNYSEKACCKSLDGKLFFGGDYGITSFYPDSILKNLQLPPVFFTGLKLFDEAINVNQLYKGRIILKKSLYFTDTVILNYNDKVITLDFVALNYIRSDRNRYKFRLLNFENDWQYLGHKHEITFASLKPGSYILEVIASNNKGLWNNRGKKLVIIIQPPFWQTLLFKLFVLLLIAAAIIGLYKERLNCIKKKNVVLNRMVEERAMEIIEKNQMLVRKTEELNSINALLEEHQQLIEKQTEELKVQRDELKKLNSSKDKLFSILAHDLRSPFNSILGFCRLLIDNLDNYSHEEIRKYLQIINDTSKHTFELLENLLQWSRSQRGTIKFNPVEFEIGLLVFGCLKILDEQALKKQITIKVHLTGKEKPVKVDPNMFNVIIRNLVSNSIKFSYPGSTIDLTLDYQGNELRVSVADQGIGMSDELISKIFHTDVPVSRKGTSGEVGSGLGISLCTDFISRHGGKYWVVSQEGKGTIFNFTIPYIYNEPVSKD